MQLIIYDGECLLCHRFMKFIYRRDREKIFTLISREDALAKEMMDKYALYQDSVFYIREDKVFIYFEAVLEIMKDLGGFYKAFYIFKVLPRVFGDFVYKLLAKHRCKIFGKIKSCTLSCEDIRSRLLKDTE